MAQITFERVRSIIVAQLAVPSDEVVLNTNFAEDFGVDRYDLRELRMALEEEYNIAIPEKDFANLTTVEDLLYYLISVVK
jgi:acyl carrier protein